MATTTTQALLANLRQRATAAGFSLALDCTGGGSSGIPCSLSACPLHGPITDPDARAARAHYSTAESFTVRELLRAIEAGHEAERRLEKLLVAPAARVPAEP